MMNSIIRNETSAKENHQICCSHCSSTVVVRNGTYPRNDPQTDTEIRVQRYLCKSPECPWKSFSALPEPILPIIRHMYVTLLSCHVMLKKGMKQVVVARKLNITRGIVKRLSVFYSKFLTWFNREKMMADWGTNPVKFWPDFTRDFSQYFFPKRWIKYPSTQDIPVY